MFISNTELKQLRDRLSGLEGDRQILSRRVSEQESRFNALVAQLGYVLETPGAIRLTRVNTEEKAV